MALIGSEWLALITLDHKVLDSNLTGVAIQS